MPCTFITGPVRSGKSRFAEHLAVEAGGDVLYVATASIDPSDAEMAARIAHHAAHRPAAWRVVETGRDEGPDLVALVRAASPEQTLLVDSLGTWLADRIRRQGPGDGAAALDAAALDDDASRCVDALLATAAQAIVVGDEVGWGIVPIYASARIFRDTLGRAHQRLARHAAAAYLVVAGYALDLRAQGRAI